MAYGYVEFGKGTRPDVVPQGDIRHNEGKRGPAETVGGAVGRVADTIGQKIHELFSGCL